MRRWAVLVPLVGLALLTAGCTETSPGEATADPGSASSGADAPTSETSSAGPTPSVEIPPRPRDISLDGLDPCTLYTAEQIAQLKVDDVEGRKSESETFAGMKECVLDVQTEEPFYTYTALAVTTEGIEVWLSGDRNVEAKLTSIAGFPAAEFHFFEVENESCSYAIDVADQQYLWVDMVPVSRGFQQDQLCEMAAQAAEMAVATLQTLR